MSAPINTIMVGFQIGVGDFRRDWTPLSWLLGWSVRIVTNALVWVLLGKMLNSEAQLTFLLIGNAVLAGPMAITWGVAASTWNRVEGNHPLLLASPASIFMVTIGRTSVWCLNGIVTSIFTFIVLGFLFKQIPPVGVWGLFLLNVVIICLSVYAFVLFIGSLVALIPRCRIIVSNIIQILFMAFCGVSVPVNFWPTPVRWLVSGLPLTNGLDAARYLFANVTDYTLISSMAKEAVVGLSWFGLAAITYIGVIGHDRVSGRSDSL